MSFTRLYVYPMREKPFRYLSFSRNRIPLKKESRADENAEGILAKLNHNTKLDESLSRTRRIVRDILFSNKFDLFCTFTFDAGKVDRFNYKDCQKKLTDFFKNYRNRHAPDFKYVIVPEFHKNGAIHFHGMLRGINPGDFEVPEYIYKRNRLSGDLILVPNTRKYVRWKNFKLGFFSCSLVKNHYACALYVSKYITKDLTQLPKGVRAVMSYEGLARPELAFDEDDVPFLPGEPDFKNEFVWISDSYHDFGLLPEWYGELASDLNDLPEEDLTEKALRDKAFFPRMTGTQLSMYGDVFIG